jgi:hypothetical protein
MPLSDNFTARVPCFGRDKKKITRNWPKYRLIYDDDFEKTSLLFRLPDGSLIMLNRNFDYKLILAAWITESKI